MPHKNFINDQRSINPILSLFWEKLKTVKQFAITQEKEAPWQGSGTVHVLLENETTILFDEKGTWERKNIAFTNKLRFRLYPDRISLEHLRFGETTPISLVDLMPEKDHSLRTLTPHLCGEDCYKAEAFLDKDGIRLVWDIKGPKKNHKIYSFYQAL
ncbi:MAG: hypothetical protein JSR76_03565 [Verrucomicrobia bacterium]|nr:hypothetical protein [Verrucomicrobiota bacterium]